MMAVFLEPARQQVRVSGLAQKINIRQGNGVTYKAEGFSVFLVALQAEPKKEILDNLWAKAAPGSRFIVRKPRNLFKRQYDGLPKNYQIVNRVKQRMLTFNQSVLYVKKDR